MPAPFEKLNDPDPSGSTALSGSEQLQLLRTLGRRGDPELRGKNGAEIKSLRFYEVPPHARYVIAKIIRAARAGDTEPFWDRGRDGKTEFQNTAQDLPDLPAGSYYEYTVLRVSEPALTTADGKPKTYGPNPANDGYAGLNKFASGAQRIVYARGPDRFYYTPTHYTGAVEGGTRYNPFFLVTDIPAGQLSGTENETLFAPGF